MLALRYCVLLMTAVALSPVSAVAQAVPARLALFGDPAARPARHGELALGSTTLAEALQLFRDTPALQSPPEMGHFPNPSTKLERSVVEVGTLVLEIRSYFMLGQGRASLMFDENDRLVSIHQMRRASDPETGEIKPMLGLAWEADAVSRNEFHAHYPGTTGRWVNRWEYKVEGMIGECLALTASFAQDTGVDQLEWLQYHYTCPTKPV